VPLSKSAVAIDAVSALLHEAAETFVLPRFDRLAEHEIERKPSANDPEDLVTVVDHEVETFLSNALPSIAAAAVLGEEAADHRPDRIGLISSDEPLWIIDPIDGTKNFAAGEDGFGIMVAYVVGGEARAAWILLPARRQLFVAEVGGGAFLNSAPIRTGPSDQTITRRADWLRRDRVHRHPRRTTGVRDLLPPAAVGPRRTGAHPDGSRWMCSTRRGTGLFLAVREPADGSRMRSRDLGDDSRPGLARASTGPLKSVLPC